MPEENIAIPTVRVEGVPRETPKWARLEQRLFAALDRGWRTFSSRYTETDGRLRFSGRIGLPPDDRDGVDDFYEPFFNWPMLYLLGGADDLLDACKRHWAGVTAQLTEMGMLLGEYDKGYDWFHQGESLIFFYLLCLADPSDAAFRERAVRFAELYVDPSRGNYDPEHNVIRAPHTGALGARPGFSDASPVFPWSEGLRPYGLPLDWVPGVRSFDQLAEDPDLAARMGRVMRSRMGAGDTAVNLAATSLAANAYLLTGQPRFREWALRYVDGWWQRSESAGGLLPDNAGPHGDVGELLDGRWYGGHYGWSWPHGLHSVGTAATIAALNASLLSSDNRYLDLGRRALDPALDEAQLRVPAEEAMSMGGRWSARLASVWHRPTLLVPYRRNDGGWFDYMPVQTALPAALWHFSGDDADWERLARLESGASYSWTEVHEFRDKEEAGHEEPWLTFLDGRNDEYPERMLSAAIAIAERRTKALEKEATGDVGGAFHRWQDENPVLTEALLQLTCGAPQVLYNGGLLQSRVRYFDAAEGRPGLPPGVSALVGSIDPEAIVIDLVNTSRLAAAVIVQAGAFAEHTVVDVRIEGRRIPVAGPRLQVLLPPLAQARIRLRILLRDREPTYAPPDYRPGAPP